MSAEPVHPRQRTLELLQRVLGPDFAVTANVQTMHEGQGVSGFQHTERSLYFGVGVSADGRLLFPRVLGGRVYVVPADDAGIRVVVALWSALQRATPKADAIAANIQAFQRGLAADMAAALGTAHVDVSLVFSEGTYHAG